jgi:hypothetical protein
MSSPVGAGARDPKPLLRQESLQNLRASGLSDETIKIAGIQEASDALLPNHAIAGGQTGYKIPYWSLGGKELETFYRVRLLPGSRDQKYHQPATQTHLYIPPPPVLGLPHN